jgi:hypothetical protein
MSCRWPTAATTKTITSQQGANPEGAGNGTPELSGVGHRCDSQFFATLNVALPGGTSHLNAALFIRLGSHLDEKSVCRTSDLGESL